MEMPGYKVSVIVPVYNVEKYIEESIRSVCEQELSGYQVILVNDGTPDGSVKIATDILDRYKTDYLLINQENKGLPGARNAGLRAARGKYVVFVDSDDIISPLFLKALYESCEKNNVPAAFADYEVTHMNNRFGSEAPEYTVDILERDDMLFKNMCRSIKIHLCATMLERRFLLDNGMWFNEALRYGEEVDFIWRVFPFIERMAHVKSKMYKYLVRENSLMTNQNAKRVVKLLETAGSDFEEWFERSPADGEKFRWAPQKVYFEKMHAFAQQAEYKTFIELLRATDYKHRAEGLFDFPDFKIRVLSRMLKYCPFLFWALFQAHKA